MNQKQKILEMFYMYGGKLTLGQMLAHPSGIGYKFASRCADLRKEGFDIRCTEGKTPSENLYQLMRWPNGVAWFFEPYAPPINYPIRRLSSIHEKWLCDDCLKLLNDSFTGRYFNANQR